MMVAVLLGALTLGACVDDNESQSVTDVREAKAAALKAAAALDNAKAAAETTIANAQAEWYTAQAAYENARAAAENADAELKQQLKEQAAQTFALTIQTLEAEMNAAIAKAKKEIAEYENTIATQNDAKLTTLYDSYSTALGTLLTLNEELTKAQANIAYLEAGVEYAKAYAKTQITDYERWIVAYKAQLAVLKDPAYTNVDNKAMYAEWQAAQQKANISWEAGRAYDGAAAKKAGDAVKAAYDALDMDLINAVNRSYRVINYNQDPDIWILYVSDIYGNKSSVGSYLYKNFRVNESNKLTADRTYASNVTTASNALGTSADAKDKATAYGLLAKANAELADANAMPETTDAEKAAKKIAIETAEGNVATAKDNLANAQIAYDNAVAAKKTFDDAFAAIDIAAYNQASAAIVAALEAQDVALEAYDEARKTPDELSAEATALRELYYNAANIDEQIANVESNIANANKWIEYYKGVYVTDQEAALTKGNELINNLNAKIEAQTKIVDAAKAALNAALAAE